MKFVVFAILLCIYNANAIKEIVFGDVTGDYIGKYDVIAKESLFQVQRRVFTFPEVKFLKSKQEPKAKKMYFHRIHL